MSHKASAYDELMNAANVYFAAKAAGDLELARQKLAEARTAASPTVAELRTAAKVSAGGHDGDSRV